MFPIRRIPFPLTEKTIGLFVRKLFAPNDFDLTTCQLVKQAIEAIKRGEF
jgi:hypothetical protein